MRMIMTNNSRIKFLIITAATIILVLLFIVVFQLVKIFQYNYRLDKLEKQIKENNNIIAYYKDQQDQNTNNNPADENIGVA